MKLKTRCSKPQPIDLMLSLMPRYVDPSEPSAGVGAICGCVRAAGFKVCPVDFNLDFEKSTQEYSKEIWKEIDRWLVDVPLANVVVDRNSQWINELSPNAREWFYQLVNKWVDQVIEKNPRWLGLSVFSVNSRKATKIFLTELKKRNPNQKVVLGGAGTTPYDQNLAALCEAYIEGDGEKAILQVLSQDFELDDGCVRYPIDQIMSLNELPFPDFSDLPLTEYQERGKQLRITGSRGCVRRCNFCDIFKIWPKYRRRSAELIVEEMVHQHNSLHTHPTHFVFNDSLINGNIPALEEMADRLIALRPKYQFTFEGQFIALGPKAMPSSLFKKLRQAGLTNVFVGIESGSEELRVKMNKKFSNEDLFHCVENLHAHSIRMVWLMIVGHPEEFDEEFAETVELFERFKKLNTDQYQIRASLHEFQTIENVPWVETNRTFLRTDKEGHWLYDKNPNLDRAQRIRRLLILEDLCHKTGYHSMSLTMERHEEFSLKNFLEDTYGKELSETLKNTVLSGY